MKFLLLNQTFHPDVVATAQYLTDVAQELARKGHAVQVISSRRAYDAPSVLFPARETWNGIDIRRARATRFGKKSKWRRAADFATFIVACCWKLLWTPRPDVVVALTSPPLISFIAACYALVRRTRFIYWVMDLNPDEAIAAGWLRESSLAARVLKAMSRFSLRRADSIIVLDRFMAELVTRNLTAPSLRASASPRLNPPSAFASSFLNPAQNGKDFRCVWWFASRCEATPSRNARRTTPESIGSGYARLGFRLSDFPLRVLPPWTHDHSVHFDPAGRDTFRATHGLTGKFVITYSGNHSPCHPLDTLLKAAQELSADPRFAFCFVGGGSEFRKVKHFARDHHLSNITCLPYQPLDRLAGSLSSADLHVVVIGDPFVGTIHPCKVYNILRIGAPLLYIGPEQSHITDLLEKLNTPNEDPASPSDLGSQISDPPSSPSSTSLRSLHSLRLNPPSDFPHPSLRASAPPRLIPAPSFSIRHNDLPALIAAIHAAANLPPRTCAPAYTALADQYSQSRLLPQLITVLESNP